jgi:hypothetical protein
MRINRGSPIASCLRASTEKRFNDMLSLSRAWVLFARDGKLQIPSVPLDSMDRIAVNHARIDR